MKTRKGGFLSHRGTPSYHPNFRLGFSMKYTIHFLVRTIYENHISSDHGCAGTIYRKKPIDDSSTGEITGRTDRTDLR